MLLSPVTLSFMNPSTMNTYTNKFSGVYIEKRKKILVRNIFNNISISKQSSLDQAALQELPDLGLLGLQKC